MRVVVTHGQSWISGSPVEIFLKVPPHHTLHLPIMPDAQTRLPYHCNPAAMGGISIHREKDERQQAEAQTSCSVAYDQGPFVTIKLSSPRSQDPGFILV